MQQGTKERPITKVGMSYDFVETCEAYAAMQTFHTAVFLYEPCGKHGYMIDCEHEQQENKSGFIGEGSI